MGSAERAYILEGAENFRALANKKPGKKIPQSWGIIEGGKSKISVGTNKTFENGKSLVVIKHPVPRDEPLPEHNHTEACEGGHAVVAIEDGADVLLASTRPDATSRGRVLLNRYSRASAGVHADEPGGSYDASVIRSKGDSVSTAVQEANVIKKKKKRHIAYVGRALRDGDLNGQQIKAIMADVDRKEEEKEKLKNTALVYILGKDGTNLKFKSSIDAKNQVELPSSAVIFDLTDNNKYNDQINLQTNDYSDKLAA
jgi:hypothetical protein